MYEELVRDLREQAEHYCKHCSEKSGEHLCGYKGDQYCGPKACLDAADAIEELQKKVVEWQEEAGMWNNKYYAEYESMPQWTSVKDQLPEELGRYLVYLSAPESEKAKWKEFGFDTDGSYVTDAFYNDRQKLWEMERDAYNTNLDVVDTSDDYAVTHWMPMPDPPKENVPTMFYPQVDGITPTVITPKKKEEK